MDEQTPFAVKDFIVATYLPDATADDLGADYDLLATGVIDSLGLLKLIRWLESEFGIDTDAVEISPDNFRSVDAVCAFIHDSMPGRDGSDGVRPGARTARAIGGEP